MRRSLADWLSWQQGLHPRDIELGLSRVRVVLDRLKVSPPTGRVFTIAGTNGKGTTAHYLAALMAGAGWRAGVYTSPHLVRYNERIRMDSRLATDSQLLAAFEAVESVRQSEALTYFEFGTLAALWLFDQAPLDAWILEVGLGGRLDAVNAIDPDYSLITSIALDHQDWLGDSVAEIAAEKAGILRPGRPGFFGGNPPPETLVAHAAKIGAQLHLAGEDFGHQRTGASWHWWSASGARHDNLVVPVPGDEPLLTNISLAMAAAACCAPELVTSAVVEEALAASPPVGRFQRVARRGREWILDVAHNPQACAALAARLEGLAEADAVTLVIGVHANKDFANVVRPLGPLAGRWIACRAGEVAGADPAELAGILESLVAAPVEWRESPQQALELAEQRSETGDFIVVCGSFEVVGPALEWLGADPTA